MNDLLKELGLTQADAAGTLGVSVSYVKQVCQGKKNTPPTWEGTLRGEGTPIRDTKEHFATKGTLPDLTPEYCAQFGYVAGTPWKDSNGRTHPQTWERIVGIFESARRCMAEGCPANRELQYAV